MKGIYGEFEDHASFREIIEVEYDRWCSSDEAQTINLNKLLKKRGSKKLTIDDWIFSMQSWGIPADRIA